MILHCKNSVRIPIGGVRDHRRQFIGVTVVDRVDEPRVNQYQWHLHSKGYAVNNAVGKLHRFILDLHKGDPEVDHISGNKLDNRRENLRLATPSLNARNRSGILGVCFHKRDQEWRGQIWGSDKRYSKGFKTKEEAVTWRGDMEIKLDHFNRP